MHGIISSWEFGSCRKGGGGNRWLSFAGGVDSCGIWLSSGGVAGGWQGVQHLDEPEHYQREQCDVEEPNSRMHFTNCSGQGGFS